MTISRFTIEDVLLYINAYLGLFEDEQDKTARHTWDSSVSTLGDSMKLKSSKPR